MSPYVFYMITCQSLSVISSTVQIENVKAYRLATFESKVEEKMKLEAACDLDDYTRWSCHSESPLLSSFRTL